MKKASSLIFGNGIGWFFTWISLRPSLSDSFFCHNTRNYERKYCNILLFWAMLQILCRISNCFDPIPLLVDWEKRNAICWPLPSNVGYCMEGGVDAEHRHPFLDACEREAWWSQPLCSLSCKSSVDNKEKKSFISTKLSCIDKKLGDVLLSVIPWLSIVDTLILVVVSSRLDCRCKVVGLIDRIVKGWPMLQTIQEPSAGYAVRVFS